MKGQQTGGSSIRCKAPRNLEAMIVDGGFDNVSQYGRSPQSKVSLETVRRAMQGTKISSFTYFLILSDLGKSRAEIKEKLYAAGDRVLCNYIGGPELLEHEELLLNIMLSLFTHSSESNFANVMNIVASMCEVSGANVSENVNAVIKLKKSGGVK